MKFPISSLLFVTASIAVSIVTLTKPHAIVAELLRFVVILGACGAVHVALGSQGPKRRSALAFSIVVFAFLGLNACPNSLAVGISSYLSPDTTPFDAFTFPKNAGVPSYKDAVNVLTGLVSTWFAFFCGCAAAAMSWAPE
ncbi:MAG: hypothetical protein AAF989_03250 [Planctomycetota bacterium]